MDASDLFRSAVVATVQTDGRTLVGTAVPFITKARVSDDGGRSFYRESFNPKAFNKTLGDRGASPFPLMVMHPFMPGSRSSTVPLGGVHFRAGAQGLDFTSKLSKTRDADEALELVNDGVMTDVSLHFRAFRDRRGTDAEGPYLERMESGIVELSLVVTGHGQHPGAKVEAVRSLGVPADTPFLAELRQRKALLRPFLLD